MATYSRSTIGGSSTGSSTPPSIAQLIKTIDTSSKPITGGPGTQKLQFTYSSDTRSQIPESQIDWSSLTQSQVREAGFGSVAEYREAYREGRVAAPEQRVQGTYKTNISSGAGSGKPSDIQGLAPGTGIRTGVTPGSGTITQQGINPQTGKPYSQLVITRKDGSKYLKEPSGRTITSTPQSFSDDVIRRLGLKPSQRGEVFTKAADYGTKTGSKYSTQISSEAGYYEARNLIKQGVKEKEIARKLKASEQLNPMEERYLQIKEPSYTDFVNKQQVAETQISEVVSSQKLDLVESIKKYGGYQEPLRYQDKLSLQLKTVKPKDLIEARKETIVLAANLVSPIYAQAVENKVYTKKELKLKRDLQRKEGYEELILKPREQIYVDTNEDFYNSPFFTGARVTKATYENLGGILLKESVLGKAVRIDVKKKYGGEASIRVGEQIKEVGRLGAGIVPYFTPAAPIMTIVDVGQARSSKELISSIGTGIVIGAAFKGATKAVPSIAKIAGVQTPAISLKVAKAAKYGLPVTVGALTAMQVSPIGAAILNEDYKTSAELRRQLSVEYAGAAIAQPLVSGGSKILAQPYELAKMKYLNRGLVERIDIIKFGQKPTIGSALNIEKVKLENIGRKILGKKPLKVPDKPFYEEVPVVTYKESARQKYGLEESGTIILQDIHRNPTGIIDLDYKKLLKEISKGKGTEFTSQARLPFVPVAGEKFVLRGGSRVGSNWNLQSRFFYESPSYSITKGSVIGKLNPSLVGKEYGVMASQFGVNLTRGKGISYGERTVDLLPENVTFKIKGEKNIVNVVPKKGESNLDYMLRARGKKYTATVGIAPENIPKVGNALERQSKIQPQEIFNYRNIRGATINIKNILSKKITKGITPGEQGKLPFMTFYYTKDLPFNLGGSFPKLQKVYEISGLGRDWKTSNVAVGTIAANVGRPPTEPSKIKIAQRDRPTSIITGEVAEKALPLSTRIKLKMQGISLKDTYVTVKEIDLSKPAQPFLAPGGGADIVDVARANPRYTKEVLETSLSGGAAKVAVRETVEELSAVPSKLVRLSGKVKGSPYFASQRPAGKQPFLKQQDVYSFFRVGKLKGKLAPNDEVYGVFINPYKDILGSSAFSKETKIGVFKDLTKKGVTGLEINPNVKPSYDFGGFKYKEITSGVYLAENIKGVSKLSDAVTPVYGVGGLKKTPKAISGSFGYSFSSAIESTRLKLPKVYPIYRLPSESKSKINDRSVNVREVSRDSLPVRSLSSSYNYFKDNVRVPETYKFNELLRGSELIREPVREPIRQPEVIREPIREPIREIEVIRRPTRDTYRYPDIVLTPRTTTMRERYETPELPKYKTPKSLKLGKGFAVVSRVKGKKKLLAVGVPKNLALAIGKKFTGKTTARSFTIKEVGTTKIKDIKPINLYQYRSPKVGKQVYREGFTFVEKSKFAIDTIGEKQMLRAGKQKRLLYK